MKVLIELLDADGCIYNIGYQNLVLYIADEFQKLTKNLEINALSQEDKDEIVNQLQEALDKASIENNDSSIYHLHQTKLIGTQKKIFNLIQEMNALSPSIMQQICIKANKYYLEHLDKEIEKLKPEYIVIVSASNRQDFLHDKLGMFNNLTNSFFFDIKNIGKYLIDKYPDKKIVCSNFSLTDYLCNYPRGTTFEVITNHYLNQQTIKAPYDKAQYFYDETKFSLIYSAIHDTITWLKNVEKINPFKTDFFANFTDNLDRILETLSKKFESYPEMLFRKVRLRLNEYSGDNVKQHGKDNFGAGILDENLEKNIPIMLECANHYSWSSVFVDQVDIAKSLNFNTFLNKRVKSLALIPYSPIHNFFPGLPAKKQTQTISNMNDEVLVFKPT